MSNKFRDIELSGSGDGGVLMYIHLSDDEVAYTEEVCSSVAVDFNSDGDPVGVEII